MKIIELKIDSEFDEAGVDGISLVERPAVEENWHYFKDDKILIVDKEKSQEIADLINEKGQDVKELEEEGWVVVSVSPVKSSKEQFITILADPNQPSAKDGPDPNTGDIYRIRYKYAGPQDTKNRDFCKAMMEKNKVFRYEDIMEMSDRLVNPVSRGQYYSIFEYRGSYNCRHRWIELKYKMDGRILNNANIKRGQVGQEYVPDQPSTLNEATANKRNSLGKFSKEGYKFDEFVMIDGRPAFKTKEEALILAETMGCEGYHEHELEGQVFYMACNEHMYSVVEEFESYNDYPESAKENACKVLRWREEHGDEVQGMTRIGWTRANQLCKGENISEETIARMSSFQRHKKNSEINEEYKGTPWKDKGYVSWLGWGGTEGIEWASRKLESIRVELDETLDGVNPCWDGYEPIGTKMKDGKRVPNCVKKTNNSKQQFSLDEERRMIYGPAMIPNKFIIRLNRVTNEPYYVFFSTETIKEISQKYLKNKYTDKTNIEHTPINLDKVYVTESWLIEDTEHDKSIKLGFRNLPEGTWMVGMKVDDDKVWDKIKLGKLNGFSVEGYFTEKLLFNNEDEQVQIIKSIINQVKGDE